jgi:hypothetical protein
MKMNHAARMRGFGDLDGQQKAIHLTAMRDIEVAEALVAELTNATPTEKEHHYWTRLRAVAPYVVAAAREVNDDA